MSSIAHCSESCCWYFCGETWVEIIYQPGNSTHSLIIESFHWLPLFPPQKLRWGWKFAWNLGQLLFTTPPCSAYQWHPLPIGATRPSPNPTSGVGKLGWRSRSRAFQTFCCQQKGEGFLGFCVTLLHLVLHECFMAPTKMSTLPGLCIHLSWFERLGILSQGFRMVGSRGVLEVFCGHFI